MKGMTFKAALFKLRAFIALIFIFSFFAFTADAFLSSTNLIILTKHVAINAILAIGMTFVIHHIRQDYSRNIDKFNPSYCVF